MATISTNMPTGKGFFARVLSSLLPRTMLAAQSLSDAELAARGLKRTDIAREIMINGTWS